jgi:hypothetical protein
MEAHRVETSRLLHFLDNRLTDGGEVVSLTRRPPFTLRKIPGGVDLRVKMRLEELGNLNNSIT